MKKVILLLLLSTYLFAVQNPYKYLDVNEKLNVMINYFVNQSLENKKPMLPVKKVLKDDGATMDMIKYESYFNYIQRIKAIRESREEEQASINEKYAGKISFYNGKLNSLKKFYQKEKNLMPIVKIAINKAFKVVFGQPKLSHVTYNEETNLLKAKLSTTNMYGLNTFEEKDLELFVFQGLRNNFMQDYTKARVDVRFSLKNNYLTYKDILFNFENNTYVGKFIQKIDEKIKLDVKINDIIFQKIKLEK